MPLASRKPQHLVAPDLKLVRHLANLHLETFSGEGRKNSVQMRGTRAIEIQKRKCPDFFRDTKKLSKASNM